MKMRKLEGEKLESNFEKVKNVINDVKSLRLELGRPLRVKSG